jgi:type 1 glutamine amidotransferase
MSTIQTLLLTGANNHDWRRTAPFLAGLLEGAGDFSVTVAEDAPAALTSADLSGMDLFVLDYNGPRWGDEAEERFLAAVRDGGAGVVVYHAANNSFKGWAGYERMVGLLWREGTGHGKFHEFSVKVTNPAHPAAAGLTDFRTEDELYHRLVPMYDTPVEILATAYSEPEQGGTGNDEPVLMATRYGAGRVFHTALGHVWPGDPDGGYRGASLVAVENPGFRASLLAGARWAARRP